VADNSGLIKIGLFAGAAYLAYSQGWLSFLGIGTAAATTTATTTTGTAATTTAVELAKVAAPSFNSLDAIYSRMVALASKDGITSTGPDVWNYYTVNAGGPSQMPSPEDAGLTRVNMTSAQYWSAMSPVLKTKLGLSGMGFYGGLGAVARRYR